MVHPSFYTHPTFMTAVVSPRGGPKILMTFAAPQLFIHCPDLEPCSL